MQIRSVVKLIKSAMVDFDNHLSAMSSRSANLSLKDLSDMMNLVMDGTSIDGYGEMSEAVALSNSTVQNCVKSIAEDVASVEWMVQKVTPKGMDPYTDHWLYPIMNESANEDMSCFDYRETITQYMLTWGNQYSFIDWSSVGRIKALWPLHPSKMRVTRSAPSQPLRYDYKVGNEWQNVPAKHIFHSRNMGNGIVGYSPIQLAAASIGHSDAMSRFGAKLFKQGVRTSGIVTAPAGMEWSDETRTQFVESFTRAYSGENSLKVVLLENGLTYTPITIAPNDAQFLESRQLQVEEILRFYRMPAMMAGHPSKTATFSSTEQFMRSYVMFTLRPWFTRLEKSLSRIIGTGITTRHNMLHLLRGNVKDRAEYLKVMISSGIISPNEGRAMEDLNPVEGGDVYYRPLNTAYLKPDGTIQTILVDEAGPGQPPRVSDGEDPEVLDTEGDIADTPTV